MRREEILARFKERMRAGETILGMQHNSGSEAVVEMLAYSGFDFVLIDMEHSGYSLTLAENLVRSAEAAGIAAFIRPVKNDPHIIMQAMETGALGLFVPHIMSRRDCEDAIAAMRYLPDGVRGKTGGSRAARWGGVDWHDYQDWANAEPLMVPIIEDREAVDVMEEILSVPGLEMISVGPGDLSQSYNAPNMGLRATPVMAALDRAIRFCQPRGICVVTIPIPDLTTEFAREIVARGARGIWYAADLINIGRHFRSIAEIRA
jgi:4-hydroxy-2-oxoheptanedioate aldolase